MQTVIRYLQSAQYAVARGIRFCSMVLSHVFVAKKCDTNHIHLATAQCKATSAKKRGQQAQVSLGSREAQKVCDTFVPDKLGNFNAVSEVNAQTQADTDRSDQTVV